MVDESIKAYLKQKLETEAGMTPENAEAGLGVCRIEKRNHPQIPTGFFIKLPQWTGSCQLIVGQAQIRT
jgi:hypothetical protein